MGPRLPAGPETFPRERRPERSPRRSSSRPASARPNPAETRKPPGERRLPVRCDPAITPSSGGRIRTCDLRVMSPTSYQTAPPRGGQRTIAPAGQASSPQGPTKTSSANALLPANQRYATSTSDGETPSATSRPAGRSWGRVPTPSRELLCDRRTWNPSMPGSCTMNADTRERPPDDLPPLARPPVRAVRRLTRLAFACVVTALAAPADGHAEEPVPYEATRASLAKHELPPGGRREVRDLHPLGRVLGARVRAARRAPVRGVSELLGVRGVVLVRAADPGLQDLEPPSADLRSDVVYDDFIPRFRAERFDPDAWVRLFEEAGARYFVLTAKHHDGFSLWCTDTTQRDACEMGPRRDLVGELFAASHRAHDAVKPGLYYSIPEWYNPAPRPTSATDGTGNNAFSSPRPSPRVTPTRRCPPRTRGTHRSRTMPPARSARSFAS